MRTLFNLGRTIVDAYFIGLIVLLVLSTWGAIALCARLLKQP